VPAAGWTPAGATLLYIWTLDLVLPTLLTASDPAALGHAAVSLLRAGAPILAPAGGALARFVERQREKNQDTGPGRGDEEDDDRGSPRSPGGGEAKASWKRRTGS